MSHYEMTDGTKVEIEDENDLPPPDYEDVDAEGELDKARQELRLALTGQLPRRRRLRLRDKEIEMSAHPENASMYSLSRDWVKPKYYRAPPSKRQSSHLPPPVSKWVNINEKGEYHSPLVPPLSNTEPQNPQLQTKTELMAEHKKRWRKIASDWRLQSKINDQRFAESYKQLHEMAKNLLQYDE